MAAGFRLVTAPQTCERFHPPELEEDDACGVPLGEPCATHDECGDVGRCLTRLEGMRFAGGYCALPLWRACWLEDGEREAFEDEFPEGPPDDEPGLYMYRPCAQDAQCRTEEGYTCLGGAFECLPDEPVFLDLHADFEAPPLCADEPRDFEDDEDWGEFEEFWPDEDFAEEEEDGRGHGRSMP